MEYNKVKKKIKQKAAAKMELEIISGLSSVGEVLVKTSKGVGAHGYNTNWRKVNENKKGKYIIVDKKRIYITIPTKGEWKLFDSWGNLSKDGYGSRRWVGETIKIK